MIQFKKVKQAQLRNGDTLVLPCEVNYCYIRNNEDVIEAVSILQPIVENQKSKIALDIETTGIDLFTSKIVLIQIGLSTNEQFIFDARNIDLQLIKPLFETDCWKIGHNLKFDGKFIKYHLGVDIRRFYDTLLAEKVLRGGEYFGGEGYSLDAVIKRRLGRELALTSNNFLQAGDPKRIEKVKKYLQESFTTLSDSDELDDAQLAYAAQDVCVGVLFDLMRWQVGKLKEDAPNTLYDKEASRISNPEIREMYENYFPPKMNLWHTALLEFKFLECVIDMELAGIAFSTDLHNKVLELIQTDFNQYREDFLHKVGTIIPQKTLFGKASINPDSTTQVLQALNGIGLNIEDTSSETLEEQIRSLTENTKHYDIVSCLLNYRKMSKLLQAFGSKLAQHVHPATGRIHSDVQQILDTGRISTSKPNCFSDDTEILTDKGWKLFKDLTDTDLVGQFNLKDETIELVKPNAFIKYWYTGNLISLKSDEIDLLVTPDHRCLLKSGGSGEFKTVLAIDYPNTGDWLQIHGQGIYSSIEDTNKSETPYDGFVYCVNVPSDFIVVRHSQKVVVTHNCQQIPSEIPWRKTGNSEIDKHISDRPNLRDCFVAKHGYKMVVMDYSLQELRVAAAITRDSMMTSALRDGKDLHTFSATLMYNVDYDELFNLLNDADKADTIEYKEAKHRRKVAKVVSFGSLYGAGPSTLSRQLNVTVDEAKEILTRFWEAYPELSRAMKRFGDFANQHGYSNTITGRRRYYTDILEKIKWIQAESTSDGIKAKIKHFKMDWLLEYFDEEKPTDKKDKEVDFNPTQIKKLKEIMIKRFRGEISRQAGNHTIQGTSADMSKSAIIHMVSEFKKQGLDARVVCMVHDEVVVEVREDQADLVFSVVENSMKRIMSGLCKSIPAKADGKISDSWQK